MSLGGGAHQLAILAGASLWGRRQSLLLFWLSSNAGNISNVSNIGNISNVSNIGNISNVSNAGNISNVSNIGNAW